ncbi:extracellular solute-binding protein, family 3 [Streptomyces viridochromogenes DSM 40736]|uniref:Extracellular solute-binding protein, family 3 n=1 Tax=Streptomyces viridochromogenes (strain DSM 40736 / JCM 4977 / BCRC 1201 / Tue 494) TaxID=591159 RepID=D9X928_STRVT|nr:ABC transporter substrate-binding protein [Streptomyces viridochromogenes]EFL30023.1 extracellular solute-binding protein, family 3 [Streptomyces viridochromogenes DSM 40736]
MLFRHTLRTSAAALALLLPFAAGCGGPAQAESPSDLSSVTLSVGATGWKTEEAVLKYAHLDDTPYKVRWSQFQGGEQQLQAVRAGALDLASSSEIPPVFAAADGAPNFKVVAVQRGATLNQEVVTRKGSKVTGIAELKGKRVGYVQNTTAHYFLYALLKQAGLKWSDIDAKPLLPNDGLAALNGGSIDALASYGTSIITAHQQGARTIGSGKDILSGNFLWSARDNVLQSPARRAAAADLIARITKAYAYVRDGREEGFAKITAAATHQPLAQARKDLVDAQRQRPTRARPVGDDTIASQQRVADTFTELGALKEHLDVKSFWTNALDADLKKAL